MEGLYYSCLAWMNILILDLDGEHPVKSELLAASKMYLANVRLLLRILIGEFVSIREP